MPPFKSFAILLLMSTQAYSQENLQLYVGDVQDEATQYIISSLVSSAEIKKAGLTLTVVSASETDVKHAEGLQPAADLYIQPIDRFAAQDVAAPYLELVVHPIIGMSTEDFSTIKQSEYWPFVEAEIGRLDLVTLGFWNPGMMNIVTLEDWEAVSDFHGMRIATVGVEHSGLEYFGAESVAANPSELFELANYKHIDGAEAFPFEDEFSAYNTFRGGTLLSGYRPLLMGLVAETKPWISLTERQRQTVKDTVEILVAKVDEMFASKESRFIQLVAQSHRLSVIDISDVVHSGDIDDLIAGWLEIGGEGRAEALALFQAVGRRGSRNPRRGGLVVPERLTPKVLFATDRVEYDDEVDPRYRFGATGNLDNRFICGALSWTPQASRRRGDAYTGEISISQDKVYKDHDCVNFLTHELTISGGAAVVFIHGYANTFISSSARAVGVATDLQLRAPLVLWSWPSLGEISAYVSDDEKADFSIQNVASLIQGLLQNDEILEVDVISHSMGGRIATSVLPILRASGTRKLDNLVFVAPDVGASNFRTYVGREPKVADLITLYASENDIALQISMSSLLHNEVRAGLGGLNLLLMDEMESIDASLVDDVLSDLLNHAHALVVPEAMNDLQLLLNQRLSAQDRGLLHATRGGLDFWIIPRIN